MSELLTNNKKNIKKPALGRGLGSLLGEDPQRKVEKEDNTQAFESKNRVLNVPIEKIAPNKDQPRKIFKLEKLKELADSIREKGVIQPILVKKMGADRYEIIAGERRWRASQMAGIHDVPVILKDTGLQEQMEIALIENIQRADLNYVEEAEAYHQLVTKFNLTQQELAKKVGKERATVANLMRILQLPQDVRELMKSDELALGQAKVLLGLDDLEEQRKLARRIVKEKLSVRETERLVAKSKNKSEEIQSARPVDDKESIHIKTLEQEMQRTLGTRVQIDYQKGRGRLMISFYSAEELNGLVDRLRSK